MTKKTNESFFMRTTLSGKREPLIPDEVKKEKKSKRESKK